MIRRLILLAALLLIMVALSSERLSARHCIQSGGVVQHLSPGRFSPCAHNGQVDLW